MHHLLGCITNASVFTITDTGSFLRFILHTFVIAGYALHIQDAFHGIPYDIDLTVTYYDEYDFRNLSGFSGMTFNSIDNIDTYDDNDGVSTNGYFDYVKGLITGSKTLVLDGAESNWVYSLNYYDDRYRLIQQQKKLYPQGTSMISYRYDFVGKVLSTYEKQNVNSTINSLLYDYEYDHMGRLVNTFITVNSEDPILLSQNYYNELGELEEKNLHAEQGNYSAFVQYIDYSYNMRGWLSSINDPYNLSEDGDLFGMELYYNIQNNNIGNSGLFNGNISGAIWTSSNESNVESYSYQYDDLSRLLSTDYRLMNKSTSSWSNPNYFETSYTYDSNGNINSLTRRNETGSLVDELTYTYYGNRLLDVSDNQNLYYYGDYNIFGTINGYDGNGNMTKCNDKGIYLDYNYLNLPEKIKVGTYAGADNISYIYDANGVKWVKLMDISTLKRIMYAGSFIYEDNDGNTTNNFTLDYILNPEGTIEMSGSTLVNYQYFLKDHLGNTRVVFDDAGTSLQEADYFPFGLTFSNNLGGDNKYLYNGKERQEDIFWAGRSLELYDYGARFYDPALGRWNVIDNKAEKYAAVSPYTYALNNPIRFIDPDGNVVVDATGKPITYTQANGWSSNATADVKRIGNAMMATGTGLKRWNAMVSANYNITLSISQDTKVSRTGSGSKNYTLGQAKSQYRTDSKGNTTIVKSDITIYEGTINQYMSDTKNSTSDKAQAYQMYTSNNDERIAAVAGHESVHAADPKNIKLQIDNVVNSATNDVEATPNAVEKSILIETGYNNIEINKPPTVKLPEPDKIKL